MVLERMEDLGFFSALSPLARSVLEGENQDLSEQHRYILVTNTIVNHILAIQHGVDRTCLIIPALCECLISSDGNKLPSRRQSINNQYLKILPLSVQLTKRLYVIMGKSRLETYTCMYMYDNNNSNKSPISLLQLDKSSGGGTILSYIIILNNYHLYTPSCKK